MSKAAKRNILFIVNPFSGTSRKGNLSKAIDQLLDLDKYSYTIEFTEYGGHAAHLAKDNADKFYMIVAVGGDGTINEVAGQLIHSNAVMGIIPGGSGNGFSMHLGIGRNVARAIQTLNSGLPTAVDTCRMNEHFFINVSGLGFDAKIAYLTKLNSRRGFMNYFKTSILQARSFRCENLEITIDDRTIKGCYAAAVVANASMYGYNFTIAPTAALDDGLMDVMLIKEAPRYQYFLMTPRFLTRSLHKSSLTETYRGKHIRIESQNPVHAHVDGEGLEKQRIFDFRIFPQSLRVMAPQ